MIVLGPQLKRVAITWPRKLSSCHLRQSQVDNFHFFAILNTAEHI